MRRIKVMSAVVAVGLGTSSMVLAQPAPSTAPEAVPAAPAVVTNPPPAAAPAPAPSAPVATPVPPGYKLVRIEDERASTERELPSASLRGRELPYEEGDAIPPGYRLREQKRRGLIIAGSIVTGIPWMISVTAATGADFEDDSGFLLVPGIGPWLMLLAGGASDDSCGQGATLCEESRAGLRAVLVLDGLVQSAGAAMFASGFLFPRQRLVRQDVTVTLAPTTLAPGAYGVGAVGTF
jgi:hypothetical protein